MEGSVTVGDPSCTFKLCKKKKEIICQANPTEPSDDFTNPLIS